MRPLTLHGAYGRFYMDAKEALDDWWAGKHFALDRVIGSYTSSKDRRKMVAEGYTHVQLIDESSREVLAVVFIGELD